jgi:hypothetical protein
MKKYFTFVLFFLTIISMFLVFLFSQNVIVPFTDTELLIHISILMVLFFVEILETHCIAISILIKLLILLMLIGLILNTLYYNEII